ncbi:MAG TPA: ABC transporter ATP-binding protein [Candidatus Baltobacteraceae bacterium]
MATNRRLTVRNLAKTFGSKVALRDVSFDVGDGEIVGFIGPNGAGKSTTFGCLAGLLRPDSGSMTYDGVELGSGRGATVALIPETPDVYPLLTVWEHLTLVARLCNLAPEWRLQGEALLTRLGMLADRDTLGNQLSKGMRQKTLIAAILLAKAPVLLLDEPMIGLDPLGQRQLREMLRALRVEGTAIVISTHQLEMAETLCDRVVIVKDGRTIAHGTIEEIRAQGSGTLEEVFLEITAR